MLFLLNIATWNTVLSMQALARNDSSLKIADEEAVKQQFAAWLKRHRDDERTSLIHEVAL